MSDQELTVSRAQQALENGSPDDAIRLLRGVLK